MLVLNNVLVAVLVVTFIEDDKCWNSPLSIVVDMDPAEFATVEFSGVFYKTLKLRLEEVDITKSQLQ